MIPAISSTNDDLRDTAYTGETTEVTWQAHGALQILRAAYAAAFRQMLRHTGTLDTIFEHPKWAFISRSDQPLPGRDRSPLKHQDRHRSLLTPSPLMFDNAEVHDQRQVIRRRADELASRHLDTEHVNRSAAENMVNA